MICRYHYLLSLLYYRRYSSLFVAKSVVPVVTFSRHFFIIILSLLFFFSFVKLHQLEAQSGGFTCGRGYTSGGSKTSLSTVSYTGPNTPVLSPSPLSRATPRNANASKFRCVHCDAVGIEVNANGHPLAPRLSLNFTLTLNFLFLFFQFIPDWDEEFVETVAGRRRSPSRLSHSIGSLPSSRRR